VFDLFFGSFFDYAVVGFQLIFGFIAITIIAKNCKKFLKLNPVEYIALLAILTFPYFPPLLVGNNICAEGLSYPLYLLLISYSFDFFFREHQKKIIHLSLVFILLCLTRGQFIVVAPIVAVLYLLKERKNILKKPKLFFLIIFLLLPFASQTLDKTYHKLVHGFFVTTPFSYVNAVTLPLFVSKKGDTENLKTEDEKILFLKTYKTIDSLGLLSSKVSGGATSKYKLFHDNFPVICNRTFHVPGMNYLENKTDKVGENVVLIEKVAKEMLPVLVKNNFKEYIAIYFEGIFHGFKGVLISIFILLLFLYSSIITLRKWSLYNGFLLFATTLIVSNAMLVAFASHSIMRYLFYNYFFAVLIGIVLLRKITSKP
jgi:O-antigen ligase